MVTTLAAQDWANLERYQQENKVLRELGIDKNRVVFMGNSITEGWSHHHPEFFKNKHYVNRGIGGQTTPQMLVRFRQDVVDLKPGVVVILAGTNDIAENTGPSSLKMIVDNIVSMAEIARGNNIKVVISSVLPAFDYSWKPGLNPDKKIPQLNILLKKYAQENGIVYVDYFKAMSDHQNGLKTAYGSDGVHPNQKGYQVMEPLVQAAIAEAIAKP